MRPFPLSLALLLAACTETAPRPPPSDRFIFPSGLVHRLPSGSTSGVLYVASANFDRCFDQGTVMAVDLDRVGLPALGTAPHDEPLWLKELQLSPQSRVFIQSYAGEMGIWDRPPDAEGRPVGSRLFVPARADGDFVHYIDASPTEPTQLSCGGSDDCVTNGAVSLAKLEGQQNDLPRAPAPFGLEVTDQGDVWVTHLEPADSPARSRTGFQSYVVRLNGRAPSVSASELLPLSSGNLAVGGSHSVKVTDRYVLVSGRTTLAQQTTQTRPFLVRVLEKSTGRIIDPALDFSFAAQEARGFALTERNPAAPTSPQRLYVAVRGPDSLLIVNAQGLDTELPRLSVVGSVPMPDGPTQVKLVSRGQGRSELVVVSCSAAGVVAIYDPDVGQVVAQVPVDVAPGQPRSDVDPQPFALDVQQQGNAARLFVSNFGDGRVSVIDIEDLGSPQQARLVAWLGKRQNQDGEGSNTCQGVEQ